MGIISLRREMKCMQYNCVVDNLTMDLRDNIGPMDELSQCGIREEIWRETSPKIENYTPIRGRLSDGDEGTGRKKYHTERNAKWTGATRTIRYKMEARH